jgi:hypothetical protein
VPQEVIVAAPPGGSGHKGVGLVMFCGIMYAAILSVYKTSGLDAK